MKSEWKSFRVDRKTTKNPRPVRDFVAYPEHLQLERARIKDLAKQKEWLPLKYRDLDIYNLEMESSESGDSESEVQNSSSDESAPYI